MNLKGTEDMGDTEAEGTDWEGNYSMYIMLG